MQVPALAERPEDVLPLALHFLEKLAGEREPALLSREAEAALVRHRWSGNVRELENRLQRATLVAADSIRPQDLGLGLGEDEDISSGSIVGALSGDQEVERQQVLKILEEGNGIIAHAAARLGISRQALYRKMDRLGIEVERRPRG